MPDTNTVKRTVTLTEPDWMRVLVALSARNKQQRLTRGAFKYGTGAYTVLTESMDANDLVHTLISNAMVK